MVEVLFKKETWIRAIGTRDLVAPISNRLDDEAPAGRDRRQR
jgi:hypothetical protein